MTAHDNSVKVYSRTVIDDAGTLSRYEYNGSFQFRGDLEAAGKELYEAWAVMMDCFYDVLFIRDGVVVVPYRMEGY